MTLAETVGVVEETAPAKLNLALHVRRRRDDGYHDLETLFAFVVHGDHVTVATANASVFAVSGPFAEGLSGQDNLVTRAEAAFRAAFGIDQPHALTLDKHLPVASGVGGGSADAAATLRALARLHAIDPADPRLHAIAATLGADVPACLLGRAAFGSGRGDDLTPIDGLGGMPALLVNPRVAVPTGPVFAAWDRVDLGPIGEGTTLDRALAGRNDLQPPAEAIAPVIRDVVALLAGQPGVRLARMSGSGATCFALFASEADRDAADQAVAAARPDWWRLPTDVV